MTLTGPGIAVVVHGGAGGARDDDDGCRQAAMAAQRELEQGGDALAAAVAAVVVMEDDGRYNAGSGSALRLDGDTIEMDAAVMDTRGRLGAVCAVQTVKNPVLLAREVADTPHLLLCGEGAQRFARARGYHAHYSVTAKARRQHRELVAQLAGPVPAMPGVDNDAFARYWNYPVDAGQGMPRDTVGAVVRDADGHFAVAGSTGGSAPAMLGRVGDTPLVGSGFYAGPAAAVAATGVGEYIVRQMLAHTVYQWIAGGMPLADALRRGVDLFAPEIDVGLIAVSADDAAACSNRDGMPRAMVRHG